MSEIKKLLSTFLFICCVFSLANTAFAAEIEPSDGKYTIRVGIENAEIDLSGLPRQPYHEGETLMVPLRLIAEALGYRVDWDAATGAITVDDDYIQKATLYSGTAVVEFKSHLKAIDMSRTIENSVITVIHDGFTYVPLEIFTEFLNVTAEENGVISVAPSICELAAE